MALDSAEQTTINSSISDSVDLTTDPQQHQNADNYSNSTNNYFDFSLPTFDWSSTFHHQCLSWQRPAHHLYFQLGNALFLIAFLAPHSSHSALCARCALVIGSILLTMWGYLVECQADVVVWNGSFLVINFVYLLILLYRLRPIRFDKEIESVSESLLSIKLIQFDQNIRISFIKTTD